MIIAFGIASLFFAILGVFVPLIGIVISGFSGFLAWMSAGKGTPLGIAAVLVNLANLLFMSPSYMHVVNMEAHLRDYDQHKMFLIWLIVLYFQISAIGVFIINFFLSLIDFSAIAQYFKKKKKSTDYSNRTLQVNNENINEHETVSYHIESTTENQSDVILLDESDEIKSEEFKYQKNLALEIKKNPNINELPVISFDGSRPNKKISKHNRSFLKVYSIVISCILIALIFAYFKSGSFSFLNYSNVNSVINSNILEKGQSYFQKTEVQQKPSKKLEDNKIAPPSTPKNHLSDYWYVIELNSGELILTQEAVITKFYVSVLLRNGQERRISKADLKSYVRRKI